MSTVRTGLEETGENIKDLWGKCIDGMTINRKGQKVSCDAMKPLSKLYSEMNPKKR